MFRTPGWIGLLVVTLIVVGESHARAADAVSKEGEIAWSGSLTTAWRAAREQQRPLLLFVTMDTCVHCQKMKQTTLKDAAVQSDLKERFIPVALNVKDEPEFIYQTPKQLREKLAPIVRQAARGKPDAAAR